MTQFLQFSALGYTDTSREIEAYHQALRQVEVGMATLDDTKDFTLKDSSKHSTQDQTEEGTGGTQGTGGGGFGLKPLGLPKPGE